MFELLEKDGWVLEWKGCVDVDGKYYFNDVSLDMSGNFYASHMFESEFSMISAVWNVLPSQIQAWLLNGLRIINLRN